jgi:hypothetical protein
LFHGERDGVCGHHWNIRRALINFHHDLSRSILGKQREQLYQLSRSLPQDTTEFGIGYTLRHIGKIPHGAALVPMDGIVGRFDEGGEYRFWNDNVFITLPTF